MKQYREFNEYDSFYVCGDIHGEFKTLVYELKRKQIANAVILLAGDCGIGFEKPSYYEQLYKKLEPSLIKINCQLLLLRGNHDDPEYFEKELISFPKMKTLPDYSVVQFGNRFVLCVGGAVSVDRKDRLDTMWKASLKKSTVIKCYWENEMPVFDKNALLEIKSKGIRIDTVVSHTTPSFCKPVSKSGVEYWMRLDENLAADLTSERNTMDEIYDRLLLDGHPLKDWLYGHFHDSNTEYISNMRFRMLDIMEILSFLYNHILETSYSVILLLFSKIQYKS